MLHEYTLPVSLFLTIVLLGWYVSSRIRTKIRLRRLGGQAPMVPYKWPFGIDMLLESIEVGSFDGELTSTIKRDRILSWFGRISLVLVVGHFEYFISCQN